MELHGSYLDSWSRAPSSPCAEGQDMVMLLFQELAGLWPDLPEFSWSHRKGVIVTGEWAGLGPAAYWTEWRFQSLADVGSVTYQLCDLRANYGFVSVSASSSETGCYEN